MSQRTWDEKVALAFWHIFPMIVSVIVVVGLGLFILDVSGKM